MTSGSPDADSTVPEPLRRRWSVWLPLLLLAGGTALFRWSDADLEIGDWFHSADKGWTWKDFPPFALLYKHGTAPGLLVAGAALVALVAGFASPALRRWRKLAVYLVLLFALGPGLLVNAVLKEHWGRPRPREVQQFGGPERFERILEYDAASPGKSFPSGHASMGFALLGLFFVGRALRRRWAAAAAAIALLLGALLGLTRVAQGGHFASDVLWSAGVCYFLALGLYHALGLDRHPWFEGGRAPRWLRIPTALACVGGLLLAVAMPYQWRSEFEAAGMVDGSLPMDLRLQLRRAELVLEPAERFGYRAHVEGFGSVGASAETRIEQGTRDGAHRIRLTEHRRGLFAAIEQPAVLTLPEGGGGKVVVEIERGSVRAAVPRGDWDWRIVVGEGDLVLSVPAGMKLKISRERVTGRVVNRVPGLEWSADKGRWRRGDEPTVRLRIAVNGDLLLEPLQ